MKKTNAMRILDSKKIVYDEIEYDTSKGISGVDVAISTGENPANVYKTLVTYLSLIHISEPTRRS